MANNVKTLEITNFKGTMTPRQNGDINSGFSYWLDASGYDPFSWPGSLS